MDKSLVKIESDEFQDTILRAINHHKGPYFIEVLGINYWMFEDCFNPAYAKASLLLMQNQGVKKGDTVLVQFSGPGLDARLAYENGAFKVVSVEKFEIPYLCAKYNTLVSGLNHKIDNRIGDLFDPIDKNEKFDLILANPPFRKMIPKGKVESAIRDNNYNTLKRFWSQVSSHLKSNGRVRAVFADVGDMKLFEELAKKNGFRSKIIATSKYASSVRIKVFEFKIEFKKK
ncbi:N-6 DNA methylase [archaeon]|nr:N-6 DNA methylase [archaeon]MBL7056911.1 N-6 DNA methylase [Candidatus Woesearchaeota archaeon]